MCMSVCVSVCVYRLQTNAEKSANRTYIKVITVITAKERTVIPGAGRALHYDVLTF